MACILFWKGFVRMTTMLFALGAALVLATSAMAAPEGVYTVKTPTTLERNPFYVSNRAPLTPNPLIKLPVGSIRPEGWVRQQLVLMADGLSGRLPELSQWCKADGNAWMSPEGQGHSPWEEVPYWLKGYGDIGYVLGDKRIINEAKSWLDGIIASQEEDGYFGPRANKEKPDLWPNMPALNALQTYYEFSGDKRVLTLMSRYFRYQLNEERDILPGYWDKMRGGDNLQSIYWLYNRTGESWLLDAAKKIHQSTARWSDEVVNWHGVNITQGYREPAVFYQQSKDPNHLQAAERNYKKVMEIYGQVPGGMFGADEVARDRYRDHRQCAETCSMVEFMNSFEMLLGITGNPLMADRAEEIAFNDLPPAQTPDLKALHYLTAPNQPQLDRESKAPGIMNGGDMFSYDPRSNRCCQHNVAMGWPYYAEHLWMATQDRGLAVVFYSSSKVTARVGADAGVQTTIVETTDYPFSEHVDFTVSPERSVRFPLLLRVPDWAYGAKVSVNGKAQSVKAEPLQWIVLDRTWKPGDKVRLILPMSLGIRTWKDNKGAVSVRRGPLWYSLKIGERWAPYWTEGRWTASEVYPSTPWNYGLTLDSTNPLSTFRVVKKSGRLAAQPWTPDAVPLEIQAKGRKIPEWGMRRGLVDVLTESPVRTSEPVEDITLIPMGAARLRIASFPVTATGPGANEWQPTISGRHEASHEYDVLDAVSDGLDPKHSNDQSIPRFTWWDQKGTEEWITWKFETSRNVSSCQVYWFDDEPEGECRVPASWVVQYKDGEEWRDVKGASAYGTAKDRINTVSFEPVETRALRVLVHLQPRFSGGILEWKIR